MNESLAGVVAMLEDGRVEEALAALRFMRSRLSGVAEALHDGGHEGLSRSVRAMVGEPVRKEVEAW